MTQFSSQIDLSRFLYLEVDYNSRLGGVSVGEAALELAVHELHASVPVDTLGKIFPLLILFVLLIFVAGNLVTHLDDAESLFEDVKVGEDLAGSATVLDGYLVMS